MYENIKLWLLIARTLDKNQTQYHKAALLKLDNDSVYLTLPTPNRSQESLMVVKGSERALTEMVGDHNNGFGQYNRARANSKKPLKSRSRGWNTKLFSIHDCFAVPCNKIEQISTNLNSAYTVIYSNRK